MEDIFISAIHNEENILARNKKLYNSVGIIKLILFSMFAICIYFIIIQQEDMPFKLTGSVLLILQIASWLYHAVLGSRIEHAEGIIAINQRHLDRISGKWTEFSDIGEEFIDSEHPYGCDLDIVGKKSLFQFLNTTHTWHGRQAFANDLLYSAYTRQQIKQRQEAVRELAQNSSLSCELEYLFSKVGSDSSSEKLVQELQNGHPFMKNRFLRFFLTYLPVLLFLFIGLSLIFHLKQFYYPAFLCMTFQLFLWALGIAATNKYVSSINRLPFRLNAYKDVLKLIENTRFSAPELQQIQANLISLDVSAAQAIKELVKITDKVNIRSNPLFYFFLNALLLWDYECAFMLESWKAKYARHCEKWFLAFGELESLLCFAAMPNVCSHTCFPQHSDRRGITAAEIGHPLLNNSSRVTNHLELNDTILIISGSNMSGKTTYLRSIGINIVLARAGGSVCAKEMLCSDLHIITSMRIADNLSEGISTFYAELKRIKRILDAAGQDSDTLFLIDEIFRGTNSVDRLCGARTVITKLNQLNVIGMITTHDLDLCELQKEMSGIQNFSFSEYYKNGQICFDYKMQPGKSKTTNARYLMELIGIS